MLPYDGFLLMCDLDGCITNTGTSTPEAWHLAAESFGLDSTLELMMRGTLGQALPEKLDFIYDTFKEKFDEGIFSLEEMYARRVDKESEIIVKLKENGDLLKRGALEELTEFYDGGMSLAIVTSSPRDRAELILEIAGIKHLFEKDGELMMASSESTEKHKPDGEPCNYIINHFIKRYGLSIEKVIGLVGDLPSDVFAGKNSLCGSGYWIEGAVLPTEQNPLTEILEACEGNMIFADWHQFASYIKALHFSSEMLCFQGAHLG